MYLKDLVGLTNDGVLTLRVTSIGPLDQTKTGKDIRKVAFLFPSTGKTHEENVFDWKLREKSIRVGDSVEIRMNGPFPDFKVIKATAEISDASQNNYQQVKNERTVTDTLNVSEKKKEREAIGKCVFGFMNTEMAKGLTPAEAKTVALDAYRNMDQAVEEIVTGDLEAQIFGEDPSPRL